MLQPAAPLQNAVRRAAVPPTQKAAGRAHGVQHALAGVIMRISPQLFPLPGFAQQLQHTGVPCGAAGICTQQQAYRSPFGMNLHQLEHSQHSACFALSIHPFAAFHG
jgi:hypothetical protein